MIPVAQYEQHYVVTESGDVIRLSTGKVLTPTINKQNGYLYVSLWKDNVGKTTAVHRLVAQAYIPNPHNKPEVNHIDSNRLNPHRDNLEWCTRAENVIHGYAYGFMSQEARRNFSDFELDLLLQSVLAGENITALAKQADVGVPHLSINLRRLAAQLNLVEQYDTELMNQKNIRNAKVSAKQRQPVLQYTLAGELVAEHESVTAGAISVGKTSTGSISNCLNPNRQQSTAYGYIWKFM